MTKKDKLIIAGAFLGGCSIYVVILVLVKMSNSLFAGVMPWIVFVLAIIAPVLLGFAAFRIEKGEKENAGPNIKRTDF